MTEADTWVLTSFVLLTFGIGWAYGQFLSIKRSFVMSLLTIAMGIAVAGGARDAFDSVRESSPKACWVEHQEDGSANRVCGLVVEAPKDAKKFSDTVPEEDQPAWDSLADGNKSGDVNP